MAAVSDPQLAVPKAVGFYCGGVGGLPVPGLGAPVSPEMFGLLTLGGVWLCVPGSAYGAVAGVSAAGWP